MKIKPLFILLLLLRTVAYSQSSKNYHISQLDYDIQSNFSYPMEWAKGTTKYDYDSNNNLTSIKTFNKDDLRDVRKYDFSHSVNKLIIKQQNGLTGNLTLDEHGRVIEANYFSALREHNKTFPYIYKFKYSPDGYLIRITAYYYDFFDNDPQPEKIRTIYQLNYDDGNLLSMKTLYVDNPEFKAPDYEFTYSDTLATNNWNPTIGLIINLQTDKYPLYSIPNNLFGKQSKNQLKSIKVAQKGGNDYQEETETTTYSMDYSFDTDGLVSQIIISHDGVNSKFNLTYKKSN